MMLKKKRLIQKLMQINKEEYFINNQKNINKMKFNIKQNNLIKAKILRLKPKQKHLIF